MTSAPDGESPEKWKRIAGLPFRRMIFATEEISVQNCLPKAEKLEKGLKGD